MNKEQIARLKELAQVAEAANSERVVAYCNLKEWGEFTPPLPMLLGEARDIKPYLGNAPIMKLGGSSMRTKNLRSQTPAGFARAFFECNP